MGSLWETSFSKITRPILARIVPRERLFTLLDKTPVTWVSAPAGYGKTTLAASYLDARDLPNLWYQLDERDAEPATFFYYLGVAGKNASARKRVPLPLLTPEYRLGLTVFTKNYFENLYSRLTLPFALVFDDYQDVPEESLLDAIIREALGLVPEGIRVILLSRQDPPPAMARLLAGQQMRIVDGSSLRFTLDEVREIVNRFAEDTWTDEMISQLHTMTDGWAAGMHLMLQEAERDGVNQRLQDRDTPAEIFDYFAHEVFEKFDADTKEFLLKTAYLPIMIPHLVEKLMALPSAGRILDRLSRGNYFAEKRFHSALAYQYHPLFKEFLLLKAENMLAREEIAVIKKRAAKILEESDYGEEAAHYYAQIEDWDGIIRLVMQKAQGLVLQGRYQTLAGWLNKLPRKVAESNPWMLFWTGMSCWTSDPLQSNVLFERAYHLFEETKDREGLFQSVYNIINCIIVGSFISDQVNFADLDPWIDVMDSLLRRYPEPLPPEIAAQATTTMFYMLWLRQPTHPDFPRWEERLWTTMQTSPDFGQKMLLASELVRSYTMTGQFSRAAELLHTIEPLSDDPFVPPLAVVVWNSKAGHHYWARADFDQAKKHLERARDLAERSGIHNWDSELLSFSIQCALSSGDLTAAERYLTIFSRQRSPHAPFQYVVYHWLASWAAFLREDFPRALYLIEGCVEMAATIGVPFVEGDMHCAFAQILFACGKHEQALHHLSEARKLWSVTRNTILEFKGLLLDAQFAFESGEDEKGLRHLAEAMRTGREGGIWNADFLLPRTLAWLCTRALDADIEVPYVTELIRKQNLDPHHIQGECEKWPWPIRICTLGGFALSLEGQEVRFTAKGKKMPLNMLKVIVSLGGDGDVSEEQVADALWPDADGDLAHTSFATTLHRLRKLLGNETAVQLRSAKVLLNPRCCWVDTRAFEHLLDQAQADEKHNNRHHAVQLLEKAVSLYRGDFLAGDSAEPWTIPLRERLRSKFQRAVEALGRCHEEAGELDRAVDCLRKGIEIAPAAEILYQRLMLCLSGMGRRAEALATFQRCETNLALHVGAEPSPATRNIYDSLRGNL